MHRDLADQRDVIFFYLAVISYVNSTCKVKKGEDVDDLCPQHFFHRVIYFRFCHQDFRRASIGQQPRYFIFPQLLLWGSCQGKLYCFRDISKTQTIKVPRGKLPREKSVTLQKSKFPQVNYQQVVFTYWVKSLQCDHSYCSSTFQEVFARKKTHLFIY